jgi:pimeloyl-ACP methyl ester carboxylesterase
MFTAAATQAICAKPSATSALRKRRGELGWHAMQGEEQVIDTGDARLHVRRFGSGPLVIAAHGFPDCARTFRHQVPALAAAGLAVALVTMRGYAPSSAADSGRYHPEALASDLVAVARALSPERPVGLLGHDWGAIASYAAAAVAPARVAALATIAVPHLRVAGPRWRRPAQLRRSWYMGFFQLPLVAERALLAHDLLLVERLWRAWSPAYRPSPEELALVKDAIRPHPGAVLSYYRELRRPAAARLLARRTRVPALYLHGRNDGCVGAELARDLDEAYAAGLETHVIEGAGHFAHLEQPAEVNAHLTKFFCATLGGRG